MPPHGVTQPAVRDASSASGSRVDLYWLPLGAGGHSVRLNGRAFEAASAAIERRPTRDLYHWNRPAEALLAQTLNEFADFPMMRRMLRGIKARAEGCTHA